MVEHTQYRSYDPDTETYDAYDDDETTDYPVGSYKFGRSAKDHSVPLFLSDPDGDPDPEEFGIPLRKSRRLSISSKILASVMVAAAVAILFALFSSDDMRNIAVNAKASFAAVLPGPSVAAQPDQVQLTAKDLQLKDPARLSGPANMTTGAPTAAAPAPVVRSPTTVAMAPSREDITTAYQGALGRAPAAAAPAATAPAAIATPASPVRRLDPGELATLMTRAKGLLAVGDIPPARLLLERAADAQEPTAALMLAQTYDPAVLGTQDARNIIPDLELARTWYQRAVQLGSAEAQRRLSQMQ